MKKAFASQTLPKVKNLGSRSSTKSVQVIDLLGERGGTRTLDPMIKRKVFKAFSIMISTRAVDNPWAVSCSNER
jgi:hypothetical protein